MGMVGVGGGGCKAHSGLPKPLQVRGLTCRRFMIFFCVGLFTWLGWIRGRSAFPFCEAFHNAFNDVLGVLFGKSGARSGGMLYAFFASFRVLRVFPLFVGHDPWLCFGFEWVQQTNRDAPSTIATCHPAAFTEHVVGVTARPTDIIFSAQAHPWKWPHPALPLPHVGGGLIACSC